MVGTGLGWLGSFVLRLELEVKRKLTSAVMGYVDTRVGHERSRLIPAGETVETTDITEGGKVRVYWSGAGDERFLMVDELELESCSVPV